MNTPEMRKSQIKGFLRLQSEQKGVVPSKLANGTKVLVETNEYMYEFTVLDTHTGRQYILNTGSPMCQENLICIKIEAHSPKLKYFMNDWIGKDMRLSLTFINLNCILVGEVKGATIMGTTVNGDEYNYDFWKKENDNKNS